MTLRPIVVALALLFLAAAPAGAAADGAHAQLVDQQGTRFSLASLRGEPVVLTFVASRCADACPIANAVFAQLQTRLRREHLSTTLVTVTLDPEFDSPMVMARVANTFHADRARWRLASGAARAVHAVMADFSIRPERGPDGIPDQHSTFIYVIDGRGHVSRTLLLSTNSTDEVTSAVKALGP